MKLRLKLLVVITCMLYCFSCDLPFGLDKQIRFKFFDDHSGPNTDSVEGNFRYETTKIIKFNVEYFEGVKSAYFVANIKSSNENTKCYLDLYNVTDNEVITTIETSNIEYVTIESNDIISLLPDSEKDLDLRIRSEDEGVYVFCNSAYLFLYR
ncbi:MAG: hypothetical protein JXR63_12980 [Spirochaetales bacterium]|nr:hypothetical protein [Spirochaetales bacterium]